ncbi:hypothetical protein TNCV_2609621 [Trichonephila clavipes]|nr:hypothetical protein TNCV_2609621 [Trichonephila clavipes]
MACLTTNYVSRKSVDSRWDRTQKLKLKKRNATSEPQIWLKTAFRREDIVICKWELLFKCKLLSRRGNGYEFLVSGKSDGKWRMCTKQNKRMDTTSITTTVPTIGGNVIVWEGGRVFILGIAWVL